MMLMDENSKSHFIKILFDIQDKHITFSTETLEKEWKRSTFSKLIHATFTKKACACPHCHSQNTVKNGFKSVNVRYLQFQNYPITIVLKKQRFLCRECNRSFLLETPIVKKMNLSPELSKFLF